MDFPFASADRLIRTALEEDVGGGDITTEATVAEGTRAAAHLVAREPLRLAGLPGFRRVFELLGDSPLRWTMHAAEGEDVAAGTRILDVEGDARTLLTGERTALNLLQRLSGIATLTARWAGRLDGTRARLVDTRKTTPGLRTLEKYAVRVGGGANHRSGLYDGILIKENHLRAGGGIAACVAAARRRAPHTLRVEVEVANLDELGQALEAGADAVLLDNMGLDDMAEAVRRARGRAILEASGGVTEDRLQAIAETGVNLISAGALTHSARAVDLSLLFGDRVGA